MENQYGFAYLDPTPYFHPFYIIEPPSQWSNWKYTLSSTSIFALIGLSNFRSQFLFVPFYDTDVQI